MNELDALRADARSELRANAELIYRHSATWSDGTTCRFSVQDPSKVDGNLARSLRSRPDAADLRILKVHQDDSRPALAARTPFDSGGVLFVERYPQQSDFLDSGLAVCRLVRPERSVAYALVFPTASGQGRDSKGNPVVVRGDPQIIPARLEASTDPSVRESVGAAAATVVLFGRWGTAGNPLPNPPGIGWGSSSVLEMQGQVGSLVVKLAWPDADPIQSQIFGEPFIATWRAGK
ncbi:hypothetical protein GCM10022631_01760 [Deinococcus rubellus]|uniref:Uncharacterized protein n=1 Tax=Deinococcus rubellus TaxID=1889240 RepID=A0ABY5YI40_9DEIO|nr:hypothetical protein [Deinococcus rubellus]UWX64757.1 hypothetical protein N0D28_03600 [Deinococcus rubellus]